MKITLLLYRLKYEGESPIENILPLMVLSAVCCGRWLFHTQRQKRAVDGFFYSLKYE